jgi:hypothetical protein
MDEKRILYIGKVWTRGARSEYRGILRKKGLK